MGPASRPLPVFSLMTVEVALQELNLDADAGTVVELQDLTVNDLLDLARYGDLDDLNLILGVCEGKKMIESCVDERHTSMVHMAAANGHVQVLKLLLGLPDVLGKMLNLQNLEGNTPLHWATLNSQVEAVRYLLDQGASLETVNGAGRTAWDEAVNRELFTVTAAILEFLEQRSKSETAGSEELLEDSEQ